MRIVCGIDLHERDATLVALRQARHLADRLHGDLWALHVVEPPAPLDESRAFDTPEHREDRIRRAGEELTRFLRENEVLVDREHVVMGSPAEELPLLACDLLVVGRLRIPALERRLLGSVSGRLVQRARCPVLVVPEGAPPRPVRSILVAIDLREDEREIRRLLGWLSRDLAAEVSCVHVFEAGEGARLLPESRPALVRSSGSVGETIAVEAARRGADLVVVGTCQRSRLSRMRRRSVARAVLRAADRPVLVVPRGWSPARPHVRSAQPPVPTALPPRP